MPRSRSPRLAAASKVLRRAVKKSATNGKNNVTRRGRSPARSRSSSATRSSRSPGRSRSSSGRTGARGTATTRRGRSPAARRKSPARRPVASSSPSPSASSSWPLADADQDVLQPGTVISLVLDDRERQWEGWAEGVLLQEDTSGSGGRWRIQVSDDHDTRGFIVTRRLDASTCGRTWALEGSDLATPALLPPVKGAGSSGATTANAAKATASTTTAAAASSDWVFDPLRKRAYYIMDGERRPTYRGAIPAALLSSGLWESLVVLHVSLTAYYYLTLGSSSSSSSSPGPWYEQIFTGGFAWAIFLRVQFGAVTWWGVWLSDWLHNLDLRQGPARMNLPSEFLWWQMDLCSISAILTSQHLLWTSHLLPFLGDTAAVAGVVCNCVGTALVAAALYSMPIVRCTKMAPQDLFCKLVFGIQFVFCMYLAYTAAFGTTNCGFFSLIWFCYVPGFACFVSKSFVDDKDHITLGLHELFHFFTFSGHALSMLLDLVQTSKLLHPTCVAIASS